MLSPDLRTVPWEDVAPGNLLLLDLDDGSAPMWCICIGGQDPNNPGRVPVCVTLASKPGTGIQIALGRYRDPAVLFSRWRLRVDSQAASGNTNPSPGTIGITPDGPVLFYRPSSTSGGLTLFYGFEGNTTGNGSAQHCSVVFNAWVLECLDASSGCWEALE